MNIQISMFYPSRSSQPPSNQPTEVHAQEAQDQPETANTLHHLAVAGAWAEVPPETVLIDSGARRVQCLAESYRDPGKNLVPEPPGQGEAASRSGNRKTENGG